MPYAFTVNELDRHLLLLQMGICSFENCLGCPTNTREAEIPYVSSRIFVLSVAYWPGSISLLPLLIQEYIQQTWQIVHMDPMSCIWQIMQVQPCFCRCCRCPCFYFLNMLLYEFFLPSPVFESSYQIDTSQSRMFLQNTM